MTDALDARFTDALDAVGATKDGAATFAELVRRHGEAHRHYHTFEHVAACLGWLDVCAGAAERPDEVALALFFHDAIYDPHASDNEAKSAELARARLSSLGAPPAAIDRIADHVLATRAHHANTSDARLTVDIDLTILGVSPAAFDVFERRIRAEYAHVPDELFVAGRRAVLEGFLARDTIYATPILHDRLERAARDNLARRIDALG